MRIPGIDRYLYNFHFLKNGKKIASIKTIAFTKFEALIDAQKLVNKKWDSYDYNHIRPANDNEENGVIITKNDLKRK